VSAATLILSPGLIQRSLHIEAPRDPDADEDGGGHSCGRDRVMRLLDWVVIFRYTWTLFRLMSRTLLGLYTNKSARSTFYIVTIKYVSYGYFCRSLED
jgi:hypothetical protein